jgi:hypothetical protein
MTIWLKSTETRKREAKKENKARRRRPPPIRIEQLKMPTKGRRNSRKIFGKICMRWSAVPTLDMKSKIWTPISNRYFTDLQYRIFNPILGRDFA